MRTETLGFLSAQLLSRLGFGAQGSRVGAAAGLVRSVLFTSQIQIYRAHEWKHLKRWEDSQLGADQRFIDYPEWVDTGRVTMVQIFEGGRPCALTLGIDPARYLEDEVTMLPDSYECKAQIEVYPVNDIVRRVRVHGIEQLGSFTLDDDRTTVDPDLLFLHALANLKAHYRQPDAEFYAGQVDNLLTSVKTDSRNQVVFPRGQTEQRYVKPKVVGRDV
jgi:hypothetical protein